MYKLKDTPEVFNLYVRVQIKYHHYNNGNLCCMLWDIDNNEPYFVVTKNIHDISNRKKAYIDLNNGGTLLSNFLKGNNIAHFTGSTITQGYCYYPLYEFNLDMNDKIFYFFNFN